MTTTTYKVKTSNSAFFQILLVGAASEEQASQLAEIESDKALSQERLDAAQHGSDVAEVQEYKAYSVEIDADHDAMALGSARLLDSGAEG